jgi:hypothetical protein
MASTPLPGTILEWVSFEQVSILPRQRYCLYGKLPTIVGLHTIAIADKQHPHAE